MVGGMKGFRILFFSSILGFEGLVAQLRREAFCKPLNVLAAKNVSLPMYMAERRITTQGTKFQCAVQCLYHIDCNTVH